MKKFKVTWYNGSVEHIDSVRRELIMTADNIDNVQYMKIVPPELKSGSYYIRGLMWDDKNRSYDYGAYNKFIWVSEIED